MDHQTATAFTKVRRQRLAEQVADAIRQAILDGSFGPGDALPSERELTQRFGVNRSSVREALHRLEAMGFVEIRHGGATRVRDFLVTAGLQVLPSLVANPKLLADLLSVRGLLLGWTARQAATKARPGSLEPLRRILADLEGPDRSTQQLKIRDFDFVEELVRLADNQVLALVVHAVRRVYFERPELFDEIYAAGRFDARHHREAVAAIERGDAEAAGRAMEAYAQTALEILGVGGQPGGR